jgi:hypothetical protein
MGMHAISGVSTILDKVNNENSSQNFYSFLRRKPTIIEIRQGSLNRDNLKKSLSPKKSSRSIKFRDDYCNKKNVSSSEQLDSNIIKPAVDINENKIYQYEEENNNLKNNLDELENYKLKQENDNEDLINKIKEMKEHTLQEENEKENLKIKIEELEGIKLKCDSDN